MAKREPSAWRAEDGTPFIGEDAKAKAKRHDAWCELVEFCRGVVAEDGDRWPDLVALHMAESAADLIRILRANPEKGGAA